MIDQDTPRMTPEELIQAGEILYGAQWQTELARAIDVDPRRVRQWINGERPIPTSLRSEIILLLKEKICGIRRLLGSAVLEIGYQAIQTKKLAISEPFYLFKQ